MDIISKNSTNLINIIGNILNIKEHIYFIKKDNNFSINYYIFLFSSINHKNFQVILGLNQDITNIFNIEFTFNNVSCSPSFLINRKIECFGKTFLFSKENAYKNIHNIITEYSTIPKNIFFNNLNKKEKYFLKKYTNKNYKKYGKNIYRAILILYENKDYRIYQILYFTYEDETILIKDTVSYLISTNLMKHFNKLNSQTGIVIDSSFTDFYPYINIRISKNEDIRFIFN